MFFDPLYFVIVGPAIVLSIDGGFTALALP